MRKYKNEIFVGEDWELFEPPSQEDVFSHKRDRFPVQQFTFVGVEDYKKQLRAKQREIKKKMIPAFGGVKRNICGAEYTKSGAENQFRIHAIDIIDEDNIPHGAGWGVRDIKIESDYGQCGMEKPTKSLKAIKRDLDEAIECLRSAIDLGNMEAIDECKVDIAELSHAQRSFRAEPKCYCGQIYAYMPDSQRRDVAINMFGIDISKE